MRLDKPLYGRYITEYMESEMDEHDIDRIMFCTAWILILILAVSLSCILTSIWMGKPTMDEEKNRVVPVLS